MVSLTCKYVHSLGRLEFSGGLTDGILVDRLTTYVIALMLKIHRLAPSLVYNLSFTLRKIIQISVSET